VPDASADDTVTPVASPTPEAAPVAEAPKKSKMGMMVGAAVAVVVLAVAAYVYLKMK